MLESRGWEVHNEIDVDHDSEPFEQYVGDEKAREDEFIRRIREREKETNKRALIVRVSHIGGHKFAGNVICYSPNGTAVWYGRVTHKEVCTLS